MAKSNSSKQPPTISVEERLARLEQTLRIQDEQKKAKKEAAKQKAKEREAIRDRRHERTKEMRLARLRQEYPGFTILDACCYHGDNLRALVKEFPSYELKVVPTYEDDNDWYANDDNVTLSITDYCHAILGKPLTDKRYCECESCHGTGLVLREREEMTMKPTFNAEGGIERWNGVRPTRNGGAR